MAFSSRANWHTWKDIVEKETIMIVGGQIDVDFLYKFMFTLWSWRMFHGCSASKREVRYTYNKGFRNAYFRYISFKLKKK